MRCWDFILRRSDGTAVRLHPEWSTHNIRTFAVEGHEETQIPRKGLGMSDGPGTYKHFKTVGQERKLRLASRNRALV